MATVAALGLGALVAYPAPDPGPARWRQPVVTVDDARVAELAGQWDTPFAVRYAPNSADITVRRATLPGLVGGEAKRTESADRITACRLTLDSDAETVVLHELGHCFGLPHSHDPDALMFWVQDSGPHPITDADRAALAALYTEVDTGSAPLSY